MLAAQIDAGLASKAPRLLIPEPQGFGGCHKVNRHFDASEDLAHAIPRAGGDRSGLKTSGSSHKLSAGECSRVEYRFRSRSEKILAYPSSGSAFRLTNHPPGYTRIASSMLSRISRNLGRSPISAKAGSPSSSFDSFCSGLTGAPFQDPCYCRRA